MTDSQILCQALLRKYPTALFALEGKKLTRWAMPPDPQNGGNQPSEVELEELYQAEVSALAATAYQGRRQKEYTPIGDQLDNITKALDFLQKSGVDIGPDGKKQVDDVAAVKLKYPKPEKIK